MDDEIFYDAAEETPSPTIDRPPPPAKEASEAAAVDDQSLEQPSPKLGFAQPVDSGNSPANWANNPPSIISDLKQREVLEVIQPAIVVTTPSSSSKPVLLQPGELNLGAVDSSNANTDDDSSAPVEANGAADVGPLALALGPEDSTEVLVKDLDTGLMIPANKLMSLTTFFGIGGPGGASDSKASAASAQDGSSPALTATTTQEEVSPRTSKKNVFKKFFRNITHESVVRTSTESTVSADSEFVKVKSKHAKGDAYIDKLKLVQEIETDTDGTNGGAASIWVMKFSRDGKYLGVGGKNGLLNLWVVVFPPSDVSSAPVDPAASANVNEFGAADFLRHPSHSYLGHTSDILDLAFSKNNFILSASSDKTVRLWHVTRKECLCVFQHTDYVTSVAFHPRDDRFFLSGCLDSRIRVWNVHEKRVQYWNELQSDSGHSGLITAVAFSPDGKFVICGSNNGTCVFYETEGLKYSTQIQVHRKGKPGEKISGMEVLHVGGDVSHLLVSTNDSRIRAYNMRDKSLVCKFQGHLNESSQIQATYNFDGNCVICGSEDGYVYIWHVDGNEEAEKIFGGRKDRNGGYEKFKVSECCVTCALIAPPQIPTSVPKQQLKSLASTHTFIVTSDFNGIIRVYQNCGTGTRVL